MKKRKQIEGPTEYATAVLNYEANRARAQKTRPRKVQCSSLALARGSKGREDGCSKTDAYYAELIARAMAPLNAALNAAKLSVDSKRNRARSNKVIGP